MKRMLCLLMGLVMMCSSFAFADGEVANDKFTGETSSIEIVINDSMFYSSDDIEHAMRVVIDEVAAKYKGSALIKLEYDDYYTVYLILSMLKQERLENGKVYLWLTADFLTDNLNGPSTYGELYVYKNWNFWLARDLGSDEWVIINHGGE